MGDILYTMFSDLFLFKFYLFKTLRSWWGVDSHTMCVLPCVLLKWFHPSLRKLVRKLLDNKHTDYRCSRKWTTVNNNSFLMEDGDSWGLVLGPINIWKLTFLLLWFIFFDGFLFDGFLFGWFLLFLFWWRFFRRRSSCLLFLGCLLQRFSIIYHIIFYMLKSVFIISTADTNQKIVSKQIPLFDDGNIYTETIYKHTKCT